MRILLGEVAVPSGAPTKMRRSLVSTVTHRVCPYCQLIWFHVGWISWEILVGSPPLKMYKPVRCAITTQSSPMPTPRTEGVPTLRETSAMDQSEGSLVPSSCV